MSVQSLNQFGPEPTLGSLELGFNFNTHNVHVDPTYTGDDIQVAEAVKLVDTGSVTGTPRVTARTAVDDPIFGIVNYTSIGNKYKASDSLQLSLAGNVLNMKVVGTIEVGQRVTVHPTEKGSVIPSNGRTPDIGYLYSKPIANSAGNLAKIYLTIDPPMFVTDDVGGLITGFDNRVIGATLNAGTGIIPGTPVEIVDSTADDIRVTAANADNDNVFGYIVHVGIASYNANNTILLLQDGAMRLRANGAITRGQEVCLNVTTAGDIDPRTNTQTIVGYALDKAADDDLLRCYLRLPSYTVAA